MKKVIWKLAIFFASVGSLLSGFFWFMSAKMQRELLYAPGAPEHVSKTMLILSADMNYWAALGAFCTGAALVLSALFED
ncbi:hypothetical protein [Xanthomonas rydalmerensis]|uniref:Uncharacterized protein n=1 Tax=Xanthomonas rydalmerensis TaxID=3046274 RepID=A0ABZ0JH81_9XANT|nr:hypothetical protein [Xanthomonas sp. DM-2023]WOS39146.1 hypothetical protein QN243_11890 [Xanthomonas sp. DM-2023]WOS43329.1 hypothetical protein QN242_11890 [Xanthomonas sp. DM-2023]WOS47509.1 hypothetical protein QN240_11890 [Xanthomonas sp. DM-2023]WOS51689.1 hypothetical protein QN244_11890 [Xanthomonas sp. DM-2023]WOS55872.1 hypothetical protein QN245_11890 [Xanthomonas sp. DM-2023]